LPVFVHTHIYLPVLHDLSLYLEKWRQLGVFIVFTALHGMQTRSSDKNSVRLSVCLSVGLSHA